MSGFEQSLLSLLDIGTAIHHLNRRSEKNLGLSIVQWVLLKTLVDMPAASAQCLARAVGVHPSTLTQTLKRLERRGYIFVDSHPKDSRKKLIGLTRSGKTMLDRANEEIASWAKSLTFVEGELVRVRTFLQGHTGLDSRNQVP